MEQWLRFGVHQVRKYLGNDPAYQKLLGQLRIAQSEYDSIVAKLSPQDREKVEYYIALCEDLEYQWTIAAWYRGNISFYPKETDSASCNFRRMGV